MLLVATGCSEYIRVQKSTDIMEKYTYAKKYFNEGKYSRTAALLEEVSPLLKSTSDGEVSLYLLAQTYEKLKNYSLAALKYQEYYKQFPTGRWAEEAQYNAGYVLSKELPDVKLDQNATYQAINELQRFLDNYPQSNKASDARNILFDLQEQLALKELQTIKLYYNLGNYIFNNYESCIITARNAMQAYPYSKYKEEMHYYIVASLYQIAYNSIESKQQERLRNLRDEYYSFINEYPSGPFQRKLEPYFVYASKKIREE